MHLESFRSCQAWVLYKESNWISAALWIIMLVCLGRYAYFAWYPVLPSLLSYLWNWDPFEWAICMKVLFRFDSQHTNNTPPQVWIKIMYYVRYFSNSYWKYSQSFNAVHSYQLRFFFFPLEIWACCSLCALLLLFLPLLFYILNFSPMNCTLSLCLF